MINTLSPLTRYVLSTLPLVKDFLTEVRNEAVNISDHLLGTQAVLSIDGKAFHCYGGSVLALMAPSSARRSLVRLITYLQTISDYLDNLCDRAGVSGKDAFMTLHQAMIDAVTPGSPARDYYAFYGRRENRYLPFLVHNCQRITAELPSLKAVYPRLIELVEYYANLQSLKHLDKSVRASSLADYITARVPNPHDLPWWELAAATGSTLGMFSLLALAASPEARAREAEDLYRVYFPWVCGLHILLDYLIDQEEDRIGGDLSFVSQYRDDDEKWQRIAAMATRALKEVQQLPNPVLHRLVVRGLLAMYLSDTKVQLQGAETRARALLRSSGMETTMLYRLCRRVRVRYIDDVTQPPPVRDEHS